MGIAMSSSCISAVGNRGLFLSDDEMRRPMDYLVGISVCYRAVNTDRGRSARLAAKMSGQLADFGNQPNCMSVGVQDFSPDVQPGGESHPEFGRNAPCDSGANSVSRASLKSTPDLWSAEAERNQLQPQPQTRSSSRPRPPIVTTTRTCRAWPSPSGVSARPTCQPGRAPAGYRSWRFAA